MHKAAVHDMHTTQVAAMLVNVKLMQLAIKSNVSHVADSMPGLLSRSKYLQHNKTSKHIGCVSS